MMRLERLSCTMNTTASTWNFLSNHGHVLVCLARQPDARLRDIAERVGITERAVQSIVGDLEASGTLTRIREGRRNRYVIHASTPLRHRIEARYTIRELLRLADPKKRRRAKGRAPKETA